MPSHITRPRGRPRQCAYCDRVFTKEEHLKRHERTHTGERPFKCYKCGKTYARSDVLFRHLQSHTSTGGNGQNDERPRRPSSDAILLEDGNTLSRNNHMQSSLNSERQSNTSTKSSITSVQRCISQPLPCHETYRPSSAMTTPPVQSKPGGLPRSGPDAPELQDYNIMNDLVAFISEEPYGNNDEVSGHVQREETCEANSQWPQKRLRLSPQSLQNSDTSPEPLTVPRLSQPQFDFHSLSARSLEETEQGCFLEDLDPSNTFNFNLWRFPGQNGMEPSLDNMYNFGCNSSDLQPSTPTADRETCNIVPKSNFFLAISLGQTQNLQRIWSRQRPKVPAPITNKLWSEVTMHKADNIFTKPQHDFNIGSYQFLGCKVDHKCRNRLIQYCKDLDSSFSSSTTTNHIPMPAVDVLDSSLDFYFQFFHPVLPFIHKSTFNARSTPAPLLFAMCLVGLSYLHGIRTKDFLIRYLKKLLPACLVDLTSMEAATSHNLTTLATVLIVAYLALGFRDDIDLYQAYALCTQTLRLADKQGLFAAEDGDKWIFKIENGTLDSDSIWEAWGRVDLICCLIYLDMAYSRLMNTSGVIEIDKVEIHLPCDDSLFNDATTASAFQRLIQQGAQMTMPQVDVRDFQRTPSAKLNQSSTQTLLRSLYLRIIAANTRLSNKHSQKSQSRLASPIERLAMDEGSKNIISDLVLLPKMHSHFLEGRQQNNALGWHYLCILLTADIDLLETACGRDGMEAAECSLIHVFEWSQSSSARRALLHAAQVFSMLDVCHIRESYFTRPDLVLFVSALVISQYFLVTGNRSVGSNVPVFELLHDIDWTTVGDEGFGRATGCVSSSVALAFEQEKLTSNSLRGFLENGGPVSFAGEAQGLGGVTAKKIARKFAHLMDRFGEWDGCSHSRLLRAMCGFTNDSD
ncbi:unnamed protein product [Fusarium venenatum]|uniref:C2H2-type domain-containing protein n=1 Tax=Fusarium venenatum TaxID=56646 RepID=A0A2L2SUT4_9HYPO|nr:uncharacterized protein FVRRES_04445 [Fusarium venenatum]CEI60009.1 unnamed protein product [Fusarium venenatum]